MERRIAMLRLCDAMLALVASLLLCLAPGSQAIAGQIELSDLLDIDPLGYQCIPSQYFDDQPDGSAALAFSVGKKMRLPRTCLPDPCARALTRTELSGLTGTEPILARFSEEWDDYYTRYADYCVREITVSRPRANTDFWKPIISRARTTQRLGVPTSSRSRPFIPATPTGNDLTALVSYAPTTTLPSGPGIGPSPVPIPASGALFASILSGLGFVAHRRRRRQSQQDSI